MPGLWDQHGKGRATGGALDDVFGVAHSPNLRASDVFQSRLWSEVDQDANFYYSNFATFLTNGNDSIMDPSGFYKAVRNMPVMNVNDYGEGRAVLMNMSPQWYNAYRNMSWDTAAEKRSVFMDFVHDAGLDRWVEIEGAGAAEHGYEITYWRQDGRTIVMVVLNPEDLVSSSVVGLREGVTPITLKFDTPVLDVRDERAGTSLGDGMRFDFDWAVNEAVVLSFSGDPVLPGDANFDGLVGLADLMALADNYGRLSGVSWRHGDFTDDGAAGLADLTVLADNYGRGSRHNLPVPEPACICLLLAGAGLLTRRRNRFSMSKSAERSADIA